MDNRVLPFISCYHLSLDQLLNCSKKCTMGRWYSLRCKNKLYFRDGAIKVMNCRYRQYSSIKCKEASYKEGKIHRDHVDPITGLTLPAIIWADGTQFWYKEGKQHRDDVDPLIALTLPAVIWADGLQIWYKEGKVHRDEVDPETGLSLPAQIWADGRQYWYKEGVQYTL